MDIELRNVMEALGEISEVSLRSGVSIISLICNAQRSSEILERVFRVLKAQGVNVQMISQVG
jgi:aspartate kinase